MCIILLAWRVHPDYPLVLAANRDEFYARPAAPLAFWPDHPQVLAGRDLEAGGTWLGITRSGRFAALTNYRDPTQILTGRPSRGQLVADYLCGQSSPEAYLDQIAEVGAQCNGFNLLVGEVSSPEGKLYWTSNVTHETRELAPGIYGVSNHLLDSAWPKVSVGKTALGRALAQLPGELALRELLADPTIHADEQLPQTGIPLEWERALSAAFIRTEGYGTRVSTLLKVSRCGTALVDEQTWLAGNNSVGERRRYRFRPASEPPR